MDAEASFRLLKEAAVEVVSDDELRALCQRAARGERPRAYIGFEPSGTAHIGWAVCTDAVRRLLDTGFDVTILLADWHAQINDKLGGDLGAIQRCAEYMKDAFEALGVDRTRVTYALANDFAADPAYWALVVQVMKNTSLARMRRSMTIMGRKEDEADADMSKFLYPAMQVADIFHLRLDLALGGLDQRHAHMLARDVAPKLGRKAPAALHTPLVPSLKGPGAGRMDPIDAPVGVGKPAPPDASGPRLPDAKMSKSNPTSGIFLHDSRDEVRAKLKAAHCPAKEVEGNPVLDLLRLVVWPRLAQLHKDGPARFEIHRPEKFGGNKLYLGWEALEAEWRSGALHPLDLKNGVADAVNAILNPVRAYFQAHPQHLEFVQALKRTR